MGCGQCGFAIPLRKPGIPDFLPDAAETAPKPVPQRVMETRFFAKIYETPVWRPLHTLIGSGMSVKREIARVLELSEPKAGADKDVILDLACGTGHFTRALAAAYPGAEVYGLDLSGSMLEQAVRIQNKVPDRPQVLFLKGDIHQIPFADASLDQINCCGALHLFPDLTPVWREIARVLKPGGLLTGEAVAIARPLARLQRRIKEQGKASFFEESWLADALAAAGMGGLLYEQHRVLALFRAERLA